MVPPLAYQLRMKPKSLPELVAAEPAAGRLASGAVVGFEGVLAAGPAWAGWAGLGSGPVLSDPQAASVAAIRTASPARARRVARFFMVCSLVSTRRLGRSSA